MKCLQLCCSGLWWCGGNSVMLQALQLVSQMHNGSSIPGWLHASAFIAVTLIWLSPSRHQVLH